MGLFQAFNISASGMTAERFRTDIIAQNIANVNTTSTKEGTPYRRKIVTFSEKNVTPFSQIYSSSKKAAVGNGVKVSSVTSDYSTDFIKEYDPSNPDADADGYVSYPNVNTVTEMTNLIDATRAYEANATAFEASKSMAKQITDISGRGVGLDVVKSGIEQLGGDVSVSTELGKGTTFTVRLPLTLAIIQALMVEIRDEIYAIALGSISNIEDIPVKDIKYVQAKEVIHLRGSVIPIIRLDKMLDIEPKEQEPDHLTVVIVQKGDQQAGLVVDNLIGQQEIVIKSLGKYINGNKLISGATILGDGDVALILDVNTLM